MQSSKHSDGGMIAMMESFKPLPALLLNVNLCEIYWKFKQSFDIFMLATVYNSKTSALKVTINTSDLLEAESQDFDKVTEAFEDYCNPVKNTVVERYKFNCHLQEEAEPFG
ncbi:hypothetical protein PR048_006373 [Dryococelus australis]|uniref:Uncharacterized protein n=1 Tax=Dryococelus australis TaxID=614101 RepID=A0ABQ9IAX2_9NEOP|nr:hypothetical protein PR048_006373 [Dryococelus australis]